MTSLSRTASKLSSMKGRRSPAASMRLGTSEEPRLTRCSSMSTPQTRWRELPDSSHVGADPASYVEDARALQRYVATDERQATLLPGAPHVAGTPQSGRPVGSFHHVRLCAKHRYVAQADSTLNGEAGPSRRERRGRAERRTAGEAPRWRGSPRQAARACVSVSALSGRSPLL